MCIYYQLDTLFSIIKIKISFLIGYDTREHTYIYTHSMIGEYVLKNQDTLPNLNYLNQENDLAIPL